MRVDLAKEVPCLQIVANLGKLVADGVGAVAGPTELVVGVDDRPEDLVAGLAGRRSVGLQEDRCRKLEKGTEGRRPLADARS